MRSSFLGAVRLMAVSAATLVAAAGTAQGAGGLAGGEATVGSAAALLDAGRVVEARELLRETAERATTTEERAAILDLLEEADRAMRSLTRSEVRLQRAQLLMDRGDLRGAEGLLEATRGDLDAGISVRARATEMLDEIARARLELSPAAVAALEQAVSHYEAGRYAEAKAGLESVRRSGVELSREGARTLGAYADRIAELERERGGAFEAEVVSLGAFGPARGIAAASLGQDGGDGGGNGDGMDGGGDGDGGGEGNGDIFTQAQEAEARSTLDRADMAFDEGRYVAADQLYTEVLTEPLTRYLTRDEIERSLSRRAEARQLAGRPDAGAEAEDFRVVLERVRAQTNAEVSSLTDDARDALARGDVDEARRSLADARLRWEEAFRDGFFNEQENRAQEEEFEELRSRIDRRSEQLALQRLAQQESDRQQIEREREREAQAELERTITESLRQLRELQREQKYDEALEVVDRILFLDPNNPAALLMKPTLENVIVYREYMEARRDKNLAIAEELSRIEEAKIVPDRVISFPEDWPQLSETRGRYSRADDFTQTPRDRAVLARLESVRLPANFDGEPLENVVAFVASLTNLNVDPDWDSLSFMGIERDTEVDLDLSSEITASTLLTRVMEKVSPDEIERAGWAVQDGIVVIASQEDLDENNFIVLYDVRDLIFEIPDFTNAPDLDLNNVLGGGGGGGGGGDSPFEDEDEEDGGFSLGFGEEEDQNREDLIDIITGAVHGIDVPDYWLIQEFNDNLVITATSSDHRKTRDLLRQLREVKNIQITLETRFLTVSSNFFEQIGFDVDLNFNVSEDDLVDGIQAQTAAQSLSPTFPGGGNLAPQSTIDAATGLPVQPGQTGATNQFVDLDPDPAIVQPGIASVPFIVPQQTGLGAVSSPQNSAGLAENLFGGSAFANAIITGDPALAITGTFLDDIQVDFLIEATQADRRSVLLQAPRLTFTNGKLANVFVGTQTGFVADQQPIVGTSAVGFDPTLETLTDGFTLEAAGVVSADRRFVTLALQVSFSGPTDFTPVTVRAVAGGTGGTDGGDIVEADIQSPTRSITSVSTGVTVPDRGTILLGGQRIATEVEIETGVPVLSKIPVLNRFFTNLVTETSEETLMILAKPTIILQREEEDKNFPGLRERLESDF